MWALPFHLLSLGIGFTFWHMELFCHTQAMSCFLLLSDRSDCTASANLFAILLTKSDSYLEKCRAWAQQSDSVNFHLYKFQGFIQAKLFWGQKIRAVLPNSSLLGIADGTRVILPNWPQKMGYFTNKVTQKPLKLLNVEEYRKHEWTEQYYVRRMRFLCFHYSENRLQEIMGHEQDWSLRHKGDTSSMLYRLSYLAAIVLQPKLYCTFCSLAHTRYCVWCWFWSFPEPRSKQDLAVIGAQSARHNCSHWVPVLWGDRPFVWRHRLHSGQLLPAHSRVTKFSPAVSYIFGFFR